MRTRADSPTKTCTESGCINALRARGLCSTHYNNLRHPDRHLRPAVCVLCGDRYQAQRRDQRFCSLLCREVHARGGPWSCVLPCTCEERRQYARARQTTRRAERRERECEPYQREDIYLRDRWRCGVCRRKVKPDLPWPHPMSATIDHVVPLSQGGGDTPANVRCTHLVCNVTRAAGGGGEQLMLIG